MKINKRNVQIAMFNKRMTQGTLAKQSGISRQTINTILARGTCKIDSAVKIAEALDLSPAEIVDVEAL